MSDLHEPGTSARSYRDPSQDEERMPFAPLEPPPELIIDTAELELPLSMADREPHQRPRLPSLKIDIDPPTQVSVPGPLAPERGPFDVAPDHPGPVEGRAPPHAAPPLPALFPDTAPQAADPQPPLLVQNEPGAEASALIASFELPDLSLDDVPTLTSPEPFAPTLPGPPSGLHAGPSAGPLAEPLPGLPAQPAADPLRAPTRPGPVAPALPKVPPDLAARVAANIASDFADDANIPMLTEVLHVPRYPGGELPAALGDVDWNQLAARVSENVMERLLRRSEKLLDDHLRESLRVVLDRAAATLSTELQSSLSQMMRDLVKRAVAEELTRVHAEIERRNFERGPR